MKSELVTDPLTTWMIDSEVVLAGFWFGSLTRKSMDRVSDLDLALFIEPNTEDTLFSNLLTFFVGSDFDITWKCHVASEKKMVFWLNDANLKLDICYGFEINDFDWIARAQDVPEPRLVEVFNSKIDVSRLLEAANSVIDPFDIKSRKLIIKNEANKFVIAFEACSSAHARSDAYLFYFHYNLALGRLVRIIQLANHSQRYLYAPRDILAKTFELGRQREIRELSGSLYLPEANTKKEHLKDEFIRVIREAESKLSTTLDIDELSVLLGSIIKRDEFFNFRDVFESIGSIGRKGHLFRSASLARYSGTERLQELYLSTSIENIIDLREAEEVEKSPYSDVDLTGINYFPVPFMSPSFNGGASDWLSFFQDNEAGIVQVLDVLTRQDGTSVIHCHIGRDRTGWLFVLLLVGLGFDDSVICNDYRASLMRTELDPIHELVPLARSYIESKLPVYGQLFSKLKVKYGLG